MTETAGFAQALNSLIDSPLFGITITLGVFEGTRWLWRKGNKHPLLTPVFLSVLIIGTVLVAFDIPYEQYFSGAKYIDFLLGPATVALAVHIYRQLGTIQDAAVPILISVVTGVAVAVGTALFVTKSLGGSDVLAISMAPKSATTPVSIALSQAAGGLPPLTAALTIIAGVIGAVAAPALMSALRIRDHRLRGLAMGVASHGIGTSRSIQEGPVEGAFAALGMALGALGTSLLLPPAMSLFTFLN